MTLKYILIQSNNFVFNKIYFHYITFFFFMISKYILFNQNKFGFNKIYFHYINFFSWYQNIFLFNQNNFVFSEKHFIIFFFCSSKMYFYYMIFLLNTFLVAYLVFNLYLQKSELYFHCVNWTAARECEKAAKKDIRILCYES